MTLAEEERETSMVVLGKVVVVNEDRSEGRWPTRSGPPSSLTVQYVEIYMMYDVNRGGLTIIEQRTT